MSGSDRKTAAELRAMAGQMQSTPWYGILRHLAAVEEEREATFKRVREERDDWRKDYEVAQEQFEDARRELEAMTRIADEQRERAKRAEQQARSFEASLFDTAKTLHATVDLVTEERRLAADALRIGLEECERLRAELRMVTEQRNARRAEVATLRNREKVGEWWEARDADGDVSGVFERRVDAERLGDRVVHVTRWRKKR